MTDAEGSQDAGTPSVGVVASEDAPEIVAGIRAAGGTARVGSAEQVVAAAPDVVVAVGEPGVVALARVGVAAPVLAVGVDGVASVPKTEVVGPLKDALAGAVGVRTRPVLSVSTPEQDARAFMDATLVSAEPATISEFAVSITPGASICRVGTDATARGAESDTKSGPSAGSDRESASGSGRSSMAGRRTVRFRADGVVVATPAGSGGYASAVGGPRLASHAGVVAVVPIAPFALDADHWVCRPEALSITVERDDTPITLRTDERSVCRLDPGAPVGFEVVDTIELVVPGG